MSRGLYRAVYSALFEDPDYQRLSPDARLTLLTVRQCEQAGLPVIFRYYPALLCQQTGLSSKRLQAALKELQEGTWIVYDAVVLWVRNGLRHNPFIRLANAKHRHAISRWLDGLPHTETVVKFCDYYEFVYPFDTHAKPNPVFSLLSTPTPIPIPKEESPERGSGVVKAALPRAASNGRPPAVAWTRGLTAAECRQQRESLGRAFVSESLLETIERTTRLSQDQRLHEARWWRAALDAYPEAQHVEEIPKAEAWLLTKGRDRKDMAAFLLNWLRKAHQDAQQAARANA